MKKNILFIFLLNFFSIQAFPQNWSAINSSNKINYQLDGYNVITSTIWVDSSIVEGNDTLYYLNRIMCDTCATVVGGPNPCDTCYGLKNQPQFLQRTSIASTSGTINFRDTANIVINTLASLNDSWLFDSTQNISATVIAVATGSVFSTIDSIKTILLSSGDTLKLSKNYGLLQYPHGYRHNSYYRLAGIQGTNIGQQVPMFADFYNINVGDMFEYHDNGANSNGAGYDIRKYVITSKQVNGDTITFGTSGLELTVNTSPPLPPSYGTINSPLYAINSPNDISNLFNHQLDSLYSQEYDFIRFSIDTNNLFSKSCGNDNDEGFVEYSSVSDTMIPMSQGESEWFEAFFSTVKVGLGETDYGYGGFENYYSSHLTAYRKGMDTVGVFTPDSLLTGVNEISSNENKLVIYPNPATNQLTIQTSSLHTNETVTVSIMNVFGQEALSYSLSFGEGRGEAIDVSKLSAGIYFVQMKSESGSVVQKFVKE